jgi:putative ABC transport system substrate-binding protein
LAAFREGLNALGYQEGRNIVIEYRWAEGNVDRLPALATELVEQKVDVILTAGNVGVRAAKNATHEIPIVAVGVSDLVAARLVDSLARPGGNLTGFIAVVPEVAAKRLEIVKEINPLARHIAVLRNPTNVQLEWDIIQKARSDLGLNFELYEAHNVGELESRLIAISEARLDFMVVLNDPFVFTYRKKISDAAARAKLPAVYGFREFVDDGGLISYGPSITETYRHAATYVGRILKGAKPSELPVQEPIKIEMIVNLKTAKALGITIPPSIMVRADEVIE